MGGIGTSIDAVDPWLADACARNAGGEIHFDSPDGAPVTRRIHLSRVTDTHVHVDVSRLDRHRGEIPFGRPVTVHLSLRGARYQFHTVVEPPDRAARIRNPTPANTVLLRRPTAVEESQRRAHLRISVAGLDPIHVDVVPVHPDYTEACAIGASPVRTTMVNISASGVGLLAESGGLDTSKDAPPFFLSFRLPDVPDGFDLLGELRYARHVKASESCRIGFAFRRWSGRSFPGDQRAITRFITEQERRLLRQRR